MDNDLLNSCEPLILAISNQFYGIDKEDLLQAGRIGLYSAYKNYKSDSNTKFSTYAYSYIFGEMYKLSIESKSIKINKETLKLIKLIEKARNYLTQSLGKIPNNNDISNYLEIDLNIINNAIIYSNKVLSLDKENEDEKTLYNLTSSDEDNDIKIDIKDSIDLLNEDEKNIIKYRYYNDLTQQQIAKMMGISQVKVSRYEQKSLKKLKKYLVYE